LKKLKKLKSIKSLRNKLDKVFNEYIRTRDGKCILSKSKNKLQCSHYYDKKASPYLRWDERNAHAMTNKMHFKHHHGKAPNYSLWMFEKYGIEFMRKLYLDSEKKFKPERNDYDRLIKYYERKLRKVSKCSK